MNDDDQDWKFKLGKEDNFKQKESRSKDTYVSRESMRQKYKKIESELTLEVKPDLSDSKYKKDKKERMVSGYVVDDEQFTYGGIIPRFFALIIDNFLVIMVALIAGFALQKIEFVMTKILNFLPDPSYLYNITTFASLFFLYLLPLSKTGQTFGRKFFGLKVVCTDHTNLGLGRTLFREIIGKSISTMVVIGYFLPLFNKQKRALHDYMSGTIVLR